MPIKFSGQILVRYKNSETKFWEECYEKWRSIIKSNHVLFWDYDTTDPGVYPYTRKTFSYDMKWEQKDAGVWYQKDNSGKQYTLIQILGDYVSWASKLKCITIQTWDYKEFHLTLEFPHRRFQYRGAEIEFYGEHLIVKFDKKSISNFRLLEYWINNKQENTHFIF